MSNFPVTITGLDALIKKLDGMPAAIRKGVDIELKSGAEEIAAQAKADAPGNTGLLRSGIGSEKDGSQELTYNVFSNVDYSAYQEFGTGAKVSIPAGLEEYAAQFKGSGSSGGLTAKAAIYEWCRLKGIDQKAWYAIYVSIMVHGINPHPFFFPAKAKQEGIIIKRVEAALNDAV